MKTNLQVAQQSESALIVGCLQNSDWFLEASLALKPQDLAGTFSRPIFQAMIELDTVEPPRVIDRAAEISGKSAQEISSYLASCFDSRLHSVQDVFSLIRLLKERSAKRQVLAYFEGQAAGDFLSCDTIAQGAARVTDRVEEIASEGEIVEDEDEAIRLSAFEYLERNGDPSRLLPTLFYDLDAMVYPARDGCLITLAGRPSHGKSRFLRNLSLNFIRQGKMVRVYSLEVRKEKVFTDIAVGLCGLRYSASRETEEHELAAITDCLCNSEELRLFKVCDFIEEDAIFRDIHRYYHRHGCGIFFLDYLQLIEGVVTGEDPRERISRITRKLKQLANKLRIQIYLLAQVGRGCESRQNKRPMLSDLKESGSIEQDSDMVWFFYVDEKYNPDTVDRGITEVIVAKQREGPTGTIRLLIDSEKQILKNIKSSYA